MIIIRYLNCLTDQPRELIRLDYGGARISSNRPAFLKPHLTAKYILNSVPLKKKNYMVHLSHSKFKRGFFDCNSSTPIWRSLMMTTAVIFIFTAKVLSPSLCLQTNSGLTNNCFTKSENCWSRMVTATFNNVL